MVRIKLEIPETGLIVVTQVKVRIDDINYGNHLSNDAYLKFMHEARLQYFARMGYSEMNLAGTSVIMGDAAIVFKKECHHGDVLEIYAGAAEFGLRSFDMYYRFIRLSDSAIVCEAKTGMVCYNYQHHKTEDLPQEFVQQVKQYS
ncbi:MAG: acyl-CoA thioesterase [Bacteroidota bacterium]|jgi:acyl-CoA thioester hydrolase